MTRVFVNLQYNVKHNLWFYSLDNEKPRIGYRLIGKNVCLDEADLFTIYIEEKYYDSYLNYQMIKDEFNAFRNWCNYITKKYGV